MIARKCTAVRITSPEYWRPLNGLAAVIDMPYRTKSAHSNFAMKPAVNDRFEISIASDTA